MNEQLKEAVSEAIREALGGALDCGRVWSAWGVGTMSEDDFSPVADDPERVAEITDAVLAALAAALPHLHPQPAELAEQQGAGSLNTSEGGRRYVADFFARELRRHDFARYITTTLAADFACALAHHLAATGKQQVGEVLTDTHVQTVPDKCDRIVWRGHYYHLPIKQVGEVQGDARHILAKHMRRIAAAYNVPRLGTEADIVEGGEEYDFWMDAAHAAVSEALAARQPGAQVPEYIRDLHDVEQGLIRNPIYAPPAQGIDLGQLPDGWSLRTLATCYQLSDGNQVVGNFVGPDAKKNAALIAALIDQRDAAPGVGS